MSVLDVPVSLLLRLFGTIALGAAGIWAILRLTELPDVIGPVELEHRPCVTIVNPPPFDWQVDAPELARETTSTP